MATYLGPDCLLSLHREAVQDGSLPDLDDDLHPVLAFYRRMVDHTLNTDHVSGFDYSSAFKQWVGPSVWMMHIDEMTVMPDALQEVVRDWVDNANAGVVSTNQHVLYQIDDAAEALYTQMRESYDTTPRDYVDCVPVREFATLVRLVRLFRERTVRASGVRGSMVHVLPFGALVYM